MSTDLPALASMKPRLVTTLLGNPGGRVMQSFVRAPWSGEYFEATIDSVVPGAASNLRISRCGADGKLIDYAVLEGGGHGASITAEYSDGKVWIWLFWGSDVTSGVGTAVRWAYNGTPSGARVLLDDAEPVPDPGAGDPGHTHGHFAIDQPRDRIATSFRSGTTETYTLWKLSDYKAGTGTALATAATTWPTGDKSAFQGFTTSDTHFYVTRGGSSVTDQPPTLYELDWSTAQITGTMDISQLAVTSTGGADGGHNEAEGVCLWRDQSGAPQLLFGIDTGPTSNRRGLVYRLAAPVDGSAVKMLLLDVWNVTGETMTNAVVSLSYDRLVRHTTGGMTPAPASEPVKLSEKDRVPVFAADHETLTDDSYGFVIHVRAAWDDLSNPGRRKSDAWTAQVSAGDPEVVALSRVLVAAGVVPPGQVGIGREGPPGPATTLRIGTVTQGAAAASVTGSSPDQILNLVLPKGDKGDPGVSSINPSSYELRGTGSPVGVVTPPNPGTFYTDVAGTNGAWRWISIGTTNTSWVLVAGDSKDRQVMWAPSGVTGSLLLRRAGNVVTANGRATWSAAGDLGSPLVLYTIPAGMRPSQSIRALGTGSGSTPCTITVDPAPNPGQIRVWQLGSRPAGWNLDLSLSWITSDTPAALPGVPSPG